MPPSSPTRCDRVSFRWLMALCAACLAGLLAGCAGPDEVEQRVPLVSGVQVPLVLTEAVDVALPPSLEPNRLVRGWWPYKRRGETRLGLLDTARLQGVNLGGVRRRLVLEGETAGKSGEIEVRIADGQWQKQPLSHRLIIPLPKELPLGRFSVDVRATEKGSFGLEKAWFSKAAEAGEVQFIDDDIIQSGFSLVESVHRLGSKSVVTGSFRPPPEATGKQRFALRVSSEDGEDEVFVWSRSLAEVSLDLSVQLPEDSEWVRIGLLATGAGPPARWENLAITTTMPAESEEGMGPERIPQVVVLYILDALRRDHVGHLGGPAGISPTIDRLAAEGVTFERHFSIAPNTVPSMKSLFTGRVFLDTGGFKLASDIPTLAEGFREAGFRTGLFSGNGNVSDWRGLTRGFEHAPRRVLFSAHRNTPGAADYNDNAEQVHNAALHWVESLDPGERVFMHLQTIHPHNPFDPPEPFLSRFAAGTGSTIDGSTETLAAISRDKRDVSEADKARIKGLYAGSVAYNDHHIGLFLARLLERYPRQEILFIVTSDHGDELFDHDSLLHGYSLYDEQLRIPLIVWWPGAVEPGSVERTTVNLDLHASLSDLLSGNGAAHGGGSSLWPMLLDRSRRQEREQEEVVFAAASSVAGGIFMARSDRLKVVYAPRRGTDWGMGQGKGRLRDPEFTFDLESDPGETVNLAGDTRLEADWLRGRLMAWIDAGRQLEEGVPLKDLDEETRESLRALGYLQ